MNISIILLFLINIIIIFNFYQNNPRNLLDFNKTEYYDEKNNLIKTTFNKSNKVYPINEIQPFLIESLIILEDQNFRMHMGTDLKRIVKVFFTNIFNKERQGASTISQQLARTLFLNTEKTYLRKLKELYYTIQLERTYSKNKILESYINNIYLGYNIYGFPDASLFYFDKELSELNEKEIILLINLIKNPSLNDPLKKSDYVYSSFIKSLNLLFNKKIIDRYLYHDILNQEVNFINNLKMSDILLENFYLDYINSEIKEKNYNLSKNNHLPKKIYTYFDNDFSNLVNSFFNKNTIDPEVSIVLLEPNTFKLKYIIGSKNYRNSSYNRAVYSKRQVGSSIKPLLYYTAFKNGFNSTTKLHSEKSSFEENGIVYSPHNFNNSYDNKPITLAYALATSDNIFAVKTLSIISNLRFHRDLKSVGLDFSKINLTSSLGSNEESLLKMTNLYNIFASLGIQTPIKTVRQIYIKDKLIYNNSTYFTKQKQILNASLVFILNDLLTLTFDTKMNQKNRVTGHSISPYLNHPYSAKTGLTDYDCYLFAFNSKVTIGIWTGYDKRKPLNDLDTFLPKKVFLETLNQYLYNEEIASYIKPYNVFESEVYLTDTYKRKSYFLQ